VISKEGIKVSPEKVKAIREYPIPQTVKDVREFCSAGLVVACRAPCDFVLPNLGMADHIVTTMFYGV
jgi:hypothetical protein